MTVEFKESVRVQVEGGTGYYGEKGRYMRERERASISRRRGVDMRERGGERAWL